MLSKVAKGVITLLAGIILLLNTLGWITVGFNILIISGALLLIAYGFIELDGLNKVKQLVHKVKIRK